MGFVSARTDGGIPIVLGDKKMTFGTYTNSDGGQGGDIDTGLRVCQAIFLQTGASVSADESAVNETLPCDGSAVTVVNTANSDGTWLAIGY